MPHLHNPGCYPRAHLRLHQQRIKTRARHKRPPSAHTESRPFREHEHAGDDECNVAALANESNLAAMACREHKQTGHY
jgi:hypothetical protein